MDIKDESYSNWNSPFKSFMTDDGDQPVIRVSIINSELATELAQINGIA